MTVVRGRVTDHGGGEVTVWIGRDTDAYPTGDVLIFPADEWEETVERATENTAERAVRLLREAAHALAVLPPKMRVRPGFLVFQTTPEALEDTAGTIERHLADARALLSSLEDGGGWSRASDGAEGS